jgi:hypothetical protein
MLTFAGSLQPAAGTSPSPEPATRPSNHLAPRSLAGRTRQIPPPTQPLSPDGVLATEQGEVRVIAGKWTVLVLLDVPKTPAWIEEEIEQAYTFVHECREVEDNVKTSWVNRLEMIQQSLPNSPQVSPSALPTPAAGPPPSPHRRTRGLLDPIGTLVHNIFGLATNAEVDDIKRVLSTLHEDDSAIVHRLHEFTTILNRSRAYEQETRTFVNAMSKRFAKINTWLAELEDDINGITMMVNFERILEDLELKSQTLYQLHQLYAHRRQDLHAGRLTEELLSAASLAQILDSIRSFEAAPLADLNWYFSHSLVRPMWAATEFLVYEVILHLVHPETFLLYRIQTWPTPLANQTAAQIREQGDFGYNTANGDLFSATSCTGTGPRVCESGPLFGDGNSALPCIRGIITSNPLLMGKCTIDITSQPQTKIYVIHDNEYVISSFGESLTTRCLGRSAIHTTIAQGIHQVHVNNSCSIFGHGWSLSSILQKSLHLHLVSRRLWRPHPLNLSAILSPLLLRAQGKNRAPSTASLYPTLSSVDPLPLDVWTAPTLHEIHWHKQTPLWVWVLVVLGVLGIAAITTYCLFLRYRCPGMVELVRKWKHGRFRPQPSKPSRGFQGATDASAPLANELHKMSDPTFHGVLMASLGVGTSDQAPDHSGNGPTYNQLRGILSARAESPDREESV